MITHGFHQDDVCTVTITRVKNGWLVKLPIFEEDPQSVIIKGAIKAQNMMKKSDIDQLIQKPSSVLPSEPEDVIETRDTLYIFKTFNEVSDFLNKLNSNDWKQLE